MEDIRPAKISATKLVDYRYKYIIKSNGEERLIDTQPSIFSCAGCYKDSIENVYLDVNSFVLHEYRPVTTEMTYMKEGRYYRMTGDKDAFGYPQFEEMNNVVEGEPIPLSNDPTQMIYRRVAIKTEDHRYQFSKRIVNGEQFEEFGFYFRYDLAEHTFKKMRPFNPVRGCVPTKEDGMSEVIFEDFELGIADVNKDYKPADVGCGCHKPSM